MDLRPALAELAEQHRLTPEALSRLHSLAGLDKEPANLHRSVSIGLAILGATLVGLGIVFWIAANWDSLGRTGRFALLQSVVLIMCAGALWRPRARLPLSILACLAIGALFAFFGQTYQTGADPWELFALWAALSLPLCLGVRHDAMWVVWTLVAMTALTLWVDTSAHDNWRDGTRHTGVHLTSWLLGLSLTACFTPPVRHHSGAGPWSMRVALTLTALLMVVACIPELFVKSGPGLDHWLSLLLLAAAAAAFTAPRLHDTYSLSVLGLAFNVLLVAYVAWRLLKGTRGEVFVPLLVTGLVAAALLAGTVKLVLHFAARYDSGRTA